MKYHKWKQVIGVKNGFAINRLYVKLGSSLTSYLIDVNQCFLYMF